MSVATFDNSPTLVTSPQATTSSSKKLGSFDDTTTVRVSTPAGTGSSARLGTFDDSNTLRVSTPASSSSGVIAGRTNDYNGSGQSTSSIFVGLTQMDTGNAINFFDISHTLDYNLTPTTGDLNAGSGRFDLNGPVVSLF